MRSFVVLLGFLTLACEGVRSTPDTAARLGSWTLPSSRLAEILVLSQPLPLEHDVAAELAREWLNVAAIARRTAAGDSLDGPELVEEATWLDRRSGLVDAWVAANAPAPGQRAAAIADSVYAAGDIRLFAHIFKRVGPETRPEEKALQKSALERIRATLVGGGAWRDANRESDDEAARAAGGIIGLVRRGDLVPEFERAAFGLQPGQLSPVVETRYGFHVIHRPTLAEARTVFVDRLTRELAARTDSVFAEALLAQHHVAFVGDAAIRAKAVAHDPWPALRRNAAIATHDQGAFTDAELARYLVHYPPDSRAEMTAAPDSVILSFLRPLIFESIVVALAERDGVTIAAPDLAAIHESYRTALADLFDVARIRPADLAASGDSAARAGEAERRVDAYLEAVAARRETLHTVPPLLAVRLIEGMDAGLVEAGIDRSVERARTLVSAASSASGTAR